METLRQSMLSDLQANSKKSRFGLFSIPPPLSLGDDSPFQTKIHPKNEQGKPITQPKNIRISPNKGTDASDLFKYTPSIGQKGDSYHDPGLSSKMLGLKLFHSDAKHEAKFKPPQGYKTPFKSAYQYVQQKTSTLDPRRKRNAQGKVLIENKNITCVAQTRAAKMISCNYSHIQDPYQRAREFQRRQRKQDKQKIKQPFKNFTGKNQSFSKDIQVYGNQGQNPKKPRQLSVNDKVVKHDRAFRASGPCKDFIGKFPQHMKQRQEQERRRNPQQSEGKKQAFKRMSGPKSGYSPSIMLNRRNISGVV